MQTQKPLRARILSLVLSMTMLFTALPSAAFATEGTAPSGTSGMTECHKEHDEACGYKEAVAGTPAVEGTPCDKACEGEHSADCAYKAAVAEIPAIEGAPCKHTCEKCEVKDSGATDKQTAYDKVVDLFTALPKASELTEENRDAFIAQLDEAMNAFDALTADEQDLFLKEQLEIYKAAMALNNAITGAAPMPLVDPVIPPFEEGVNTRYKVDDTVYSTRLQIGDRVVPGAVFLNEGSKPLKVFFDSYELFLTGGYDETAGPYGEISVNANYGIATILDKYEKVGGGDEGAANVTTRSEWVCYNVLSSGAPLFTSADRTVLAEYDATVDKTGLSGAEAQFEIELAEGSLPVDGDTFKVANYDKLKITITPTGSNVFATAPTVSSTNTTTVGTPAKQADGSYVCEIETFTGNPTITVAGTAGVASSAPEITTASLPDAILAEAYSQTLTATGKTPITWSVTTGSLPTGLTLNGSTGVISGTPTTEGTATFTVKAANGDTPDATKELSITVNEKPAITTTTLPNAKLGTAYSETLAATGTAPITWTLSSGSSLPAGLTLSTAGVISGTPTTEGTTNFTVEATNITGTKVTQSLSILVNPAKTDITITGLTKADATYDGTAKAGYTGTANTGAYTGSLEYTYYSGSSATGTALSGAPTNAGTYTVVAAIPASNTDYMGAHAPITFAIAKKTVNATYGSGKVTKVYDKTTAAGTGAITLNTSDIVSSDTGVSVAAGTIPAYSAATVGNAYSLTVPVVLNGDSNNNYTLNTSTVTVPGEITAKPVTLADGTLAITKEYDGTTTAGTATGALASTDFVSGDDVAVSVTAVGNYADDSVAQNKSVDLSVELTGSAAGNYSLSSTTYSFTKAEITKATPTVTVTAAKKETFSLFGIDLGNKEETFIITVTVAGKNGGKPAGTVQIKANGTNLGSALTLNNGGATYEWVKPAAGTYTFTADFTATGANYTNATGTSEQYDVSKSDQAELSFDGVPATVTYGDSKIAFATTGGSGTGAVTYTSSDTNVITNDGTIKGKGTATITATKAGDTNYNAATATAIIKVNAATPTLAWEAADTTQSVVYTGSAASIKAPKVTLVGSDTFGGTIEYSYKAKGLFSLFAGDTEGLPTEAGEYTIKAHITEAGNYAAADSTNELTLTINKSTPSLTINTMNGKTYDGTAVAPPAEGGMTITGASYTDIKFAYSTDSGMSGSTTTAPTNAGTYYVQASVLAGGNTNAAQSAAVSFTIQKAALSITGGTVTQRAYDGTTTATVTALTFSGLATGETLTVTTDYGVGTPVYNSADAGTTKTVTGTATLVSNAKTDNYTLTSAYSIANQTIDKKTGIGAPTGITLNDTANTFEFGLVSGYTNVGDYEWKMESESTWTTVTANPIPVGDKAGKIEIRVKETTNFEAGAIYKHDASFTADLTGTATISGTAVYGGTLTANMSGQQVGAELHYSWSDGTNTIGTDSKTFVLTGDMIGKTIKVEIDAKDYSGKKTASTATVAKASVTATVTGVDKEYDGSNQANLALSITKVNAGDEITITAPNAVYDNKNVGNSKTITVGSLTITGAAKDWYDVSVPAVTGKITEKAVTVSVTAADKAYDGTTTASATYTVNGKIGTEAVVATGTAAFDNANAGTNKTVNITGIALSGADSSNYSLGSNTATTQASISKAAVTVAIDAIGTENFTGSQIKPTVTVKTTGGTALASTDYTLEYGANVDAGTGSVTVKAATNGNYTFSDVTANFTINKVAYTGTPITGTKLVAQNTAQTGMTFDLNTLTLPVGFKEKTFGAVSYSANSDGVLTGTPSISGDTLTFDIGSVAKDKSGVIDIVVSSKNYTDYTVKITVTTVDKTPVTINGTAATGLVYNGSAQQGYTTVAVEGNKVPQDGLDFTYSGTDKSGAAYGPTATAPTKAGDYKLVVSVKSSNATYTGTSSDILFSIEQKPLTIRAIDKFTYQHKELPATELAYDGFIAGEDKTVLGANAYTAAHSVTDTDTVGNNFAIVVSGSTANKNYNITTTNGNLTIYVVTIPEAPKPTPPTTSVTNPEIVAEPAAPANPGDPAKQLRVFSGELAPEDKTEALKQLTIPTGGVTTTQEVELQVSNDGGATWSKATLADVKDGKVQVVLPIPAGTSSSTHTYKIYHFANGATVAPETLTPDVNNATNSLSATVKSLSPFVVVATPKGGSGGDGDGGGGGGGGGGSSTTYYYIKATAGPGGYMSTPERVKVRAGESAGFTITPDKGYQIEDVLVNGKSIGAKNYYAFTNVHSDQTIHATFKQISEHKNPQTGVSFDDVQTSDWFYDAVMEATANGWFNGTSDTTFSPYAPTSRGMIATILHRMENTPGSAAASFTDVASDAYYANGVAWAQEHGIVTGYGNGNYGPNNNITREQLASILYRYAGYKGYDVSKTAALGSFADASGISDYAKDAMSWSVGSGLISGRGNNTLAPTATATRAEVAVILVRFKELFIK